MHKVIWPAIVTVFGISVMTGCSTNPVNAAGENGQRNPATAPQHLSGEAARDFIEKHFPNADIPGSVEGKFTYVQGVLKTGSAKCFYPAMGEQSDGEIPSCDIQETNHFQLTGAAADEFIEKHFPNADIPGAVEGKFIYRHGVAKTGFAKCFYPAMGGQSGGAIPTCDVSY